MPVEAYLGEIYISALPYAPKNFALCNGQLIAIAQNTALFALLGTIYGGNGQTTFALPDLRGRTPIHFGAHDQGEVGGEASHTLQLGEIPAHTHSLTAVKEFGTSANPTGNRLATATGMMGNAYGPAAGLVATAAASVGNTGGSQAHNNLMPSLGLNFYICVVGQFPPRN